jgi:cryptochrome
MLDEELEKKRCMARLKAAYHVGLHGSDKEVLDGTADGLVKDEYKDSLPSESSGRKKSKSEDTKRSTRGSKRKSKDSNDGDSGADGRRSKKAK